jgi:hypothetical protein
MRILVPVENNGDDHAHVLTERHALSVDCRSLCWRLEGFRTFLDDVEKLQGGY